MTCNMWHMTCDMWHMTHYLWKVTGGRRWTFTQNFSSLAFRVWELEVSCDTWYVTPDTWHVTHDIWHVSCDTQGVMNTLSTFQVPALMVWVSRCLEDSVRKDHWLNYEGVQRTALATPGLLRTWNANPTSTFPPCHAHHIFTELFKWFECVVLT